MAKKSPPAGGSKTASRKKASPKQPSPKKPAAKKRAAKSPQKTTASAKKKPAASSAAKKSRSAKPTRAARSAKSATGKKASAATAAERTSSAKPTKTTVRKASRRPARQTAKKGEAGSPGVRKTVDAYVATLNGWRKECVSGLRKMVRTAAAQRPEKVKWSLPDARKLWEGTGQKVRQVKLSSLKDAGKREWRELVRLAAKLNELKASPKGAGKTKPRVKSKRK